MVISIRAYSADRKETALIANGIVNAYCEMLYSEVPEWDTNHVFALGSPLWVEIAKPALKPVRPNKVLNLVLGTVAGILIGSIAGGIVAGLASLSRSKPHLN